MSTECASGLLPSSGSMVSVKFKRSSGFGNTIFIVLGRDSSVKSGSVSDTANPWPGETFLDADLGGADFGFLRRYYVNDISRYRIVS